MDITPKKTYNDQQTYEKMLNIINFQRNVNQIYNEVPPHTGWNDHC